MIRADSLIRWIREHAVSRSMTVVDGWILGDDLLALAKRIREDEPFEYVPRPEDDVRGNP